MKPNMLQGQSSPLNVNPVLPFAWAMWPTGLLLSVGSRPPGYLPAKRVAIIACIPQSWPSAYDAEKLGSTVRTKWLHRGPAHYTKNCQAHWRSCTHVMARHNTASSANLSRVEFFRTNWSSQNLDPCGVPHFVAQLFHALWDLTCSVPCSGVPALANKISSNSLQIADVRSSADNACTSSKNVKICSLGRKLFLHQRIVHYLPLPKRHNVLHAPLAPTT